MMIYSVYSSKYNKETLHTLRDDFTLPEFLLHREWCTLNEDLEKEAHETATADSKKRKPR